VSIGYLDGIRFFSLGQFLLEQGVVSCFQFASRLIRLLGQFDCPVLGRAANFAQYFIVQRAGANRKIGPFDILFTNDIVFVLLESSFDRVGATRRAVVAGDGFDDAVRRPGSAVDQFLVEHDASLGLNGVSVAFQIGAIDFNTLAGFRGNSLPGGGGRSGPRQGGEQAGDHQ
jgi:hypothetical protein